jgi:hypothetical protein
MKIFQTILSSLMCVLLVESVSAMDKDRMIGDGAECLSAINTFIISKNYEYEINNKNYDLIIDTIRKCEHKWPAVRILDTPKVRIVLLWRADEDKKFRQFNSPIVKVAFPLVPLTDNQDTPIFIGLKSSQAKKIEEIDADDPEMLSYKTFGFLGDNTISLK